MTLLLVLILVPFFISINNSKLINIISLLFGFLLYGFCIHTNDTSIYMNRYYAWDDSWRIKITEPLYTWTVILFRNINFSFQEFFFIIAAVFVICFAFFVNKLTNKISYVVGLTLISIYPMLITLQRSSYAFSFVFLAFYFLLFSSRKIVKITLFTTFIAISSLIHSMCIMFFLFGLAYFIDFKRIQKYTIITTIVIIMAISIMNTLFHSFFTFINMEEKYKMLSEHADTVKDIVKSTILALLRVLSVIALPIGIKYILTKNYKTQLSTTDNIIFKLNFVGLLFCPLLYISHDIYRIFYPFAIMNFCLASHYLTYNYCKWYSLFCCLNIGYWFIYRPCFDHVFIEVYTHNYIFDFLW